MEKVSCSQKNKMDEICYEHRREYTEQQHSDGDPQA